MISQFRLEVLAALIFCAVSGTAGEKIAWDPAVNCTPADAEKTVADGTLQVKCPVAWEKYNYLVITLKCKPFVPGGRAIALTVQCKDFQGSDSFYVKGVDAQGRVVTSFYTFNPLKKATRLICVPGRDYGGMKFFANDVKAPDGTAVSKLMFFIGRRGPAKLIECLISGLELVPAPPMPKTTGFRDLGVGIASAELRFCIAALDANKRPVVAAVPLDTGRNYLLLTELDTGKTFQFYPEPAVGGAAYGGVLTPGGKLVYGTGKKVLIFDLNTRRFTAAGPTVDATLCGAAAPDGTAYLGGAPEAKLTQIDPVKGTARDCGRMDDREHYLQSLAVDREGVVYCGIGSARANIVAWDPKSGKRTQLLPENLRKLGYGKVVQGKDGFVYASFGDCRIKCLGGKIVAENVSCPEADSARQLYYGARQYEIGDGSRIISYDLVKRSIRYGNANGQLRDIPVNYVSGGLDLTSLAAGPDGKVYFSSAHPHHLGFIDPASGKLTDLGYNPVVSGGNFCNMTAANGKLYACEYAGGRMWEYDPALPVMYNAAKVRNFGIPFGTLLMNTAACGGRWSELANMGLLLGIGENEDNALTLKLKVPQAGKWYLNGQFYQSEAYGTVTLSAGGKKLVCNVQADPAAPGRVWSLGPFDLPTGRFPVEFSIAANAGDKRSRRFFSLIGLELAAAPRKDQAPAAAVPQLNPRILGRWADLATRPRTIAVHPDGKTAIMAGYANYGMVGGGFGVHDLISGKNREIANFLPGESCIAMGFLPDGMLFGGTCTEAPGGGHTTAAHASVFHYDLANGKLLHCIPVPCRTVGAVTCWKEMIYAVGNDSQLYRIDPKTWKIAGVTRIEGGPVPRNGLLVTPDGKRLFLLQQKLISEIMPDGTLVTLAMPPHPIYSGGAAIGGKLYYAHSASRLGCWDYQQER